LKCRRKNEVENKKKKSGDVEMTIKKVMTNVLVIAGLTASSAIAQQAAAPAQKSWTDSVLVKGDVRYRFETIDDASKKDSTKNTFTRERDRVRARLDVEAKPSDTLKLGVGFSTGGNDPISGNQTIGDVWQKKDMKLNLAYFDWSLIANEPSSVNLVGGKQKNPFQPMGSCQDLVWDNDATPEGLVLKGQTGTEMITLAGNLGYMWIQERQYGSDDSMLYVGQGYVKVQPMPEIALTLGGSYYDYSKIKGQDVIDWAGANSGYGNSTIKGTVSGSTTNKAWANEFKPVELFGGVDMFVMEFPVQVFAQTVNNGDANSLKKGMKYGVCFGKAKNPNSFEVGYAYEKLEKDAVLGCLTDSDRWGGGTDGKGSKVWGKYAVSKNMTVGVSYFVDDKGISGTATDYKRMQADLQYSF